MASEGSGRGHRPAPWYSRRNRSSRDAGVTVRSMIPRSVSCAVGAVQIVAVDREPVVAVRDREIVDERGALQRLAVGAGAHCHGGAHQVPQLIEGAGLHRAPGADDRHLVAELFHLGEDVARQQHRRAAAGNFLDALLKCLLHQGVQARGRLVEDVELGVRGERGHNGHLLAVALGVRAGLLVRVEFEALDQLVAASGVDAVATQTCQKVDGLKPGEVGPQRHIARHIGDSAMQTDRVAPRVAAEQAHGSAVGPEQAEQHADGGGLACAVRPEEAGDVTRRDGQVEAVESFRAAERLGQTPDFDCELRPCGVSPLQVPGCVSRHRVLLRWR